MSQLVAASDIDALHVINNITAVAATCCEWHHSARRSLLAAGKHWQK
jgi:hypothetical protein